jgi:hypothetical protein
VVADEVHQQGSRLHVGVTPYTVDGDRNVHLGLLRVGRAAGRKGTGRSSGAGRG